MFSKSRISFDIKDNVIKVVEGKLLDIDVLKINRAAFIDMSEGVFKEGRLISCQENIDVLKNFLKKNNFKETRSLLNISDNKIVTRVIKLPKLSLSDIKSLIMSEAPKYFPIDISSYHIDYRVLDTFSENDKLYYSILLCAVPKDIIREYVDLFTACGLKLDIIDIHSNSVSRLYENIEYEDIAIMDVNVTGIELLIINKGNYDIYTTFPYKIPNYADLLRHPEQYDTSKVYEDLFGMGRNVQSYINFYLTKNEGKRLEKIYLTGDLTLIEGIEDKLSQVLKMNVLKGFDEYVEIKKKRKLANMNEDFYNGNIGILLRGA